MPVHEWTDGRTNIGKLSRILRLRQNSQLSVFVWICTLILAWALVWQSELSIFRYRKLGNHSRERVTQCSLGVTQQKCTRKKWQLKENAGLHRRCVNNAYLPNFEICGGEMSCNVVETEFAWHTSMAVTLSWAAGQQFGWCWCWLCPRWCRPSLSVCGVLPPCQLICPRHPPRPPGAGHPPNITPAPRETVLQRKSFTWYDKNHHPGKMGSL